MSVSLEERFVGGVDYAAKTPVVPYRGAGTELPNLFGMARRAASKQVHSFPFAFYKSL
jgi:hypothetical protein